MALRALPISHLAMQLADCRLSIRQPPVQREHVSRNARIRVAILVRSA